MFTTPVLSEIRDRLRSYGFRLPSSDRLAEHAKWLAKLNGGSWRVVLFVFNTALTNGNPGYEPHGFVVPETAAEKTAQWLKKVA